jgi:hypothetical protein
MASLDKVSKRPYQDLIKFGAGLGYKMPQKNRYWYKQIKLCNALHRKSPLKKINLDKKPILVVLGFELKAFNLLGT